MMSSPTDALTVARPPREPGAPLVATPPADVPATGRSNRAPDRSAAPLFTPDEPAPRLSIDPRSPRWISTALCAALAAGCQTPGPKPVEPESASVSVGVPAGFPMEERWSQAGVVAPVEAGWIGRLGDPALAALVEEAVGASLTLRAESARVRGALARAAAESAALRPALDATGGVQRNASPGIGPAVNRFDLRLDLTVDPDLWGRLSDSARAAAAEARAQRERFAAARLALAADVARAWFQAVEANAQATLAGETARNLEANLEVVEETFRAGLGRALDVWLERANLAAARSRARARRRALDASVRSLEALLGRHPAGRLVPSDALPTFDEPIPSGLPSELVERRPDVRAAAARLDAAGARIDGARKALLPSFRLTGGVGLASGEPGALLDLDALLWSLAASVAAPLLDGGRIEAQTAFERARANEALAEYAATLLDAFREVESALAAEHHLTRQEASLREAAAQSREAAMLSLERYRVGLVDIVTWLEARRRAFDAESALITVSAERIQNRIALYLALGGDFSAAGSGRKAVGTDYNLVGSASDP